MKRVSSHAGRSGWVAGLVPRMTPFISCMWASMAAAKRNQDSMVPVACMRSGLQWLQAFLERRRGSLKQVYGSAWATCLMVGITCDASPWGYGAWLSVQGVPHQWLAGAWTKDDCKRMKLEIGSCKGQAVWEALVILIACRVWLPDWSAEWITVVGRSDSKAALSACGKLKSKSPNINLIARELALDSAECSNQIDAWEHIEGRRNDWADCLSRLVEPGSVKANIPSELLRLRRRIPPPRDDAWWETTSAP
jgi:hypothetical protein